MNRGEQHKCKRTIQYRLLILQVFIACDEDLEAFRSNQFEQFPILHATPARPGDRSDVVAKELPRQRVWHVFIE